MIWITCAVLAALPTLGLVSGPAYAPLVFGLAGLRLLYGLAMRRTLPRVDRPLALVGAIFVALCWLSVLWSINPGQSARGALQLTGILVAALLAIVHDDWMEQCSGGTVLRVVALAIVTGGCIVAMDVLSGYRLTVLHADWYRANLFTKYNRGINYLILLAWPILGYLTLRGRPRLAVAMAALIAIPVIVGESGSARAGSVAGIAVLVSVWLWPRLAPKLVGGATLIVPVALPVGLRMFSGYRAALAPHLPGSGVHRLEIWDYVSARILEHPVLGWGFSSAKFLPVRPEEIAQYQYADGIGIYPHNQWLQVWVDLGAAGMMLGLVFLAIVLRRIAALPERLRPFAQAALGTAMTYSLVNYEISTDSWWAALAASALLFSIAARQTGGQH